MLNRTTFLCCAAVAALGVAGCQEQSSPRPTKTSAPATSAMPTAEEQACLEAVGRVTENPDIVLLGSDFSQAGTFVKVGVGPDQAPWKCIAYSDGSTADVEFMGSEGGA